MLSWANLYLDSFREETAKETINLCLMAKGRSCDLDED